MESLLEMLKSKSASDQARIAERRAAREELSQQRDEALTAVTSKQKLYDRYLILQADNPQCSVGNVALTLRQMENPSKIGSAAFWHNQDRRVRDEEMANGAKVFVPSKDPKRPGYFMGDYYDISQTEGRPLRELAPLVEDTERLQAAISAILDTTRTGWAVNETLDAPARYNEEICTIELNPVQYSRMQVFTALSSEVSYAIMHNGGNNRDFDRAAYQLDAESIGFMVCRRFGVDCPLPNSKSVGKLYADYEPADRAAALSALRETAQNVGDRIEKRIQPRQQTRQQSSNKRQFARR